MPFFVSYFKIDFSLLEGISTEVSGIKRMRAVLVNFVRKKGLDPLRAKTWRLISKSSLREEKVRKKISKKFQKNLQKKKKKNGEL
jgi:hypothetical protein